jgi:tetratricopeptide (TPR) repeat protein
MVLRGVTISNNAKSKDDNHMILVPALVSLILLATVGYLQVLPVNASVVESLKTRTNWYDNALGVNQNNVPALVEKGTELVATGNPEQALTWLNKALSIDAENMMGLVSKGTALRELGKYQEAIVAYDKVLAIDPHDEYAIGGKADSLYMSGQHERAITWINKALELNPSDAKIQFVHESLSQAIK